MEVKPGYKLTEVGAIPEDWGTRPCSAISDLITVGIVIRPTQYYVAHGVPALRSANIREAGINGSDMVFITEKANAVLSKSRVQAGDVLTVRTGYPGTSAVVSPSFAGSNCIDILITRPSSRFVRAHFLTAWINSPFGRLQILRNQEGLAQQHFNVGDLKSLVVALPPLSEQDAIAEALSNADAFIESLTQLIAKKRDIKQGAVLELLTGEKRLPGFNGPWRDVRIGDITLPSAEKNVAAERLPVLTCSKHVGFVDSLGYFKNQVFSEDTSTYKVIRRGCLGYPSNHVEEGSIGIQNMYDVALVSPIYVVFSVRNSVNGDFLHRLLKQDSFRQRFKAATSSSVERRGSLRWPAFSEIVVGLPGLEEQTAVATVLSDMDNEIAALEAKLAAARQIRQGMMKNLLTGKMRLI